MKKNLRAICIFTGCISASVGLMILTALIPKQNLYLTTKNEIVTIKSNGKQIQSNYTFLALILLSGSIPLSVMACLVASNRLPEIELEAEEYNKQRMIRKIRRQSDLDTERELCNANKTVTVTAHEKNLESAFVDLAEASNWHYVSDEEEVNDSHIASISTTEDQKKKFFNVERYHESQLLNDLAYSDKSMILVGSNGSGKSHTLSLYLELLYEQTRNKNQVASVWILARKNDSFCGLREANKLVIFNTLDPTEAFKLIERVYKNFQARLKVVEEVDRVNLPPLRLILEDWSSTVMILKKAHKSLWTKIELMLLDIITVGREYNVCLLILTHTIGLEALGLVVDSNLRANLTIVVQGLIRNELGRIKGDYLLIELAIKNQFIVPDNSLRSVYLTQVNDLIPESRKKQVPIYFTTLGNGGVGILPYIEKSNIDFTEREINESLVFDSEFRLSEYLSKDEEDFDIEVVEEDSIRDSLEKLYLMKDETISNDIIEVKSQEDKELKDVEIIYYTSLKLDRKNAIELILKLKNEMKHTQTQIIWMLWNARPGKTKAYVDAVSEYKELMKGEINEE